METRKLGRTAIEVSRIGLGCTTFGREIDEATSVQIMDYAVAQSITLFDTAEGYGGGQAREYRRQFLGVDDVREVSGEMHSSEKIVGRWLKSRGCRDQVILQTKVSTNFTQSHVAAAVDASLERLRTDVIDLYLFHSYDANTPLEEALEAMTRVIQAGKVRVAGCSNFSADQLQSALEISRREGLARMEVTQPNYNLVAREIEQDLIPLCREQKVAVVTYSPLGAGFLTGKYTPDRKAIPKGTRFDVIEDHADIYFSERNFRIVERLRQKAQAVGVPMVRLALAWVLRNPEVTSVLVGARTTTHLDNALQALAMEFPDSWAAEMNRWE